MTVLQVAFALAKQRSRLQYQAHTPESSRSRAHTSMIQRELVIKATLELLLYRSIAQYTSSGVRPRNWIGSFQIGAVAEHNL
jgi:hypothetical protein